MSELSAVLRMYERSGRCRVEGRDPARGGRGSDPRVQVKGTATVGWLKNWEARFDARRSEPPDVHPVRERGLSSDVVTVSLTACPGAPPPHHVDGRERVVPGDLDDDAVSRDPDAGAAEKSKEGAGRVRCPAPRQEADQSRVRDVSREVVDETYERHLVSPRGRSAGVARTVRTASCSRPCADRTEPSTSSPPRRSSPWCRRSTSARAPSPTWSRRSNPRTGRRASSRSGAR